MESVQGNLFRQEAVDGRAIRLQGDVFLSNSVGFHVIAAAIVVTVGMLSVWIAVGSYTRSETAPGILATDVSSPRIFALQPGLVKRLAVGEGQSVKKGDLLAVVQVDRNYAEGFRATDESLNSLDVQRELAREQAAASHRLAQEEQAGLRAAIDSSHDQIADLEIQISIQEQLVRSLNAALERYKPVAERGFVSKNEMERRIQDEMAARQTLARLNQQKTTLISDERRSAAQLRQSRVEEKLKDVEIRSSREQIAMRAADIHGQRTYVLQAPLNGVVTAMQSSVGRSVDPAVPLMTIVPARALFHAELYAPTRAIGFVHPGQEVRLLYDAFPYEHFGSFPGVIRSVSRIALDPRQVDSPVQAKEPVYKIVVALKNQTIATSGGTLALQAGMTLSANIILDRRSFLEWLLQPIISVQSRNR